MEDTYPFLDERTDQFISEEVALVLAVYRASAMRTTYFKGILQLGCACCQRKLCSSIQVVRILLQAPIARWQHKHETSFMFVSVCAGT